MVVLGVVVAAVAVGGAMLVATHRPEAGAAAVDREDLYLGEVARGTMTRDIRSTGTLAPVHVQWITAISPARVESIEVRPGARVEADTVLVRLSNPDLELQALESERSLAAAQSTLATLQTSFRDQELDQETTIVTLTHELENAERKARSASDLGNQGVLSTEDVDEADVLARSLRKRLALARKRLQSIGTARTHQLEAQREEIERLEKVVKRRRQTLDALEVRAGVAGVVQHLPLETGQWVQVGGLIAKVAKPDQLEASVKVLEAQAKDVSVGLEAEVDTFNGTVAGHVSRIDPVVEDGAVVVDIELSGPLPRGARPDLTVEATIHVDRLEDVLYIERPAMPAHDGRMTMYRMSPDLGTAHAVDVTLGRSSAHHVEIVHGLQEGDTVILSDTTSLSGHEEISVR